LANRNGPAGGKIEWNYHILVKSQSQTCPLETLQSKSGNLNDALAKGNEIWLQLLQQLNQLHQLSLEAA